MAAPFNYDAWHLAPIAREQYLECLVCDLVGRVSSLSDRVCALEGTSSGTGYVIQPEHATSAEPSPTVADTENPQIRSSLNFIASWAQDAIRNAGICPDAIVLLQSLEISKLVEAHDMVRIEVNKNKRCLAGIPIPRPCANKSEDGSPCGDCKSCLRKDPCGDCKPCLYKNALRLVRDLLILHLFGRSAKHKVSVEEALTEAFRQARRTMSTELMSQLKQSYSTIVRLSGNRTGESGFDQTFKKCFGESIDGEPLDSFREDLFVAYREVAATFARKKRGQQAGQDECPTDMAGEGDAQPAQAPAAPGSSAACGAEESATPGTEQPPVPRSHASTPSRKEAQEQSLVLRCDECTSLDVNTLKYIKTGRYLCTKCMIKVNSWRKFLEENPWRKFLEEIPENPGDLVRFYDHTQLPKLEVEPSLNVEPTKVSKQTKVHVEAICCVDAARRACRAGANRSICVLVHGRERGPTVEQEYRQSKDVCENSSLQQAFPQGEMRGVPPKGGIFVRNVCLRDEGGRFDPSLRVSMVYAAAAKRPDAKDGEAEQIYFEEMYVKVQNILRIMRMHSQEELILGAWGCGEFLKAPPLRMAKIFHEVIRDSEFDGHFSKITFAILPATSTNFTDFESEFHAAFD